MKTERGKPIDQPAWREISHTADWALEVYGQNLERLFLNAAEGMFDLLGGVPKSDHDMKTITVEVQAEDWETLMVDWLTELLYWVESEGMILRDITIKRLERYSLLAEVSGQPGGDFRKHIKAVTFHNLTIHDIEQGYMTEIVFDV